MSTDGVKQPDEVLANQAEHPAETGGSSTVLETIDINEMQPTVDKVVHVTKIYIPPKDPEASVTGPLAVVKEDVPGTAHSEVTTPRVMFKTEAVTMAGSVENVPAEKEEIVEVQLQPTNPAAHPLPGVTVDVDSPKKVGEIVPITIQPAYPAAHTADDDLSTDIVVIPAFPATYLPAPAPFLEESVPAVQIKPDLVHYGTVVTGGSPATSEVHSSFAEPLYPAAHPLPTLSGGTSNCDDGMSEISLPPVDPGSSQVNDDRTTANGTANNVHIIIQPRNTSRKRSIFFTVALLILLASSFAVAGVFHFYLKDSPA